MTSGDCLCGAHRFKRRAFAIGVGWWIFSAALGTAQIARSADEGWQTSFREQVRIDPDGPNAWKVSSKAANEFTIESEQTFACKPGDTFAVNIHIRVDLNTKALPELVCYDSGGKEIPIRSSLEFGPRYFTTDWQELRRVLPVQPGTASVRARVRGSGKGSIDLAELQFHP
ncbi:MAG TPA: hypothetical protein VKH44_08160, partial [Pirellulaceae bacterium]|nr:hypothetical protein [Pirellulaceae bacterium]